MKRTMIFLSIIAIGMLLFCCGGKTDLATRYEMEKKLNETDKLQDKFNIKGAEFTESDANSLIESYLDIADMVDLPKDSSRIASASPEKLQTWELAMLAYTRAGALCYGKLKEYDRAFSYFKIIIECPAAKPAQKGAAYNYMALCREDAGKYQEAIDYYQKLADGYTAYIAPENPNIDVLNAPIKIAEIWQNLGNEAKYTAQLEQARTYYNKLLPLHPKSPFASAVLGKIIATYLRENKFQQAINLLEGTRDKATGMVTPRVLMIMADIYMNSLQDFAGAERVYREFVKNYREETEIAPMTLGLALTLFKQDKFKQARDTVKDIEKLPGARSNTVAEAYFLTALCYEKEGRWEQAIGQFNLVQATFGGTNKAFEAGLHVANYYLAKGQDKLSRQKYEETAEYINKYTNPETSNPGIAVNALSYLVRCYSEMQDLDKTIATLETLFSRYPQSAEAAYAPLKLADLYENELKNYPKAIEWLNKFMEANPNAGDLDKIRAHIKELEVR